jgi:hypothetical protein
MGHPFFVSPYKKIDSLADIFLTHHINPQRYIGKILPHAIVKYQCLTGKLELKELQE